ncbi:uncharacterized protein LOC144640919 [Oculina patagonica]
MRLSLAFLLCAIIASLYYSTEADRFYDSRYQLGKALLRRAREINETKTNADELEDEMSEEERERVMQTDAAEDIFVGSGNHVYESQGRSDTSGSKREETSNDEDSESEEEEEDDNSPTSGDSNDGENSENDEGDEDDDEKSDDDNDDGTETQKGQESAEDEDTSGSGLIENENAARRSSDTSGSGSGSEQQEDDTDQSGSGESTIEELAPAAASQDEASGTEENASKKSEIETASGDSEVEEDDEESGSAEVIKKGIESLSRLLTPVASGYDFELYSGNAAKNDKQEETEAEGESEKGFSSNTEEVHVKKCKRVCEDPMSYEQCAVPRCDYKMGTIKDLCIYLCKHQTPVCRQQCE